MAKRTEEQIVAQAPIVVILGGKEYKIAPLVIRDSREWRKKVIGLVAPLPGLVEGTKKPLMDNTEDFENILTQMMVVMPDQVLDVFFEYAEDLDREEIESIATDAEMAKAFEEVVKVAFPLVESLPKVMERFSR